MQEQLSEILENILGLLLLEGSYDIQEEPDSFNVTIDTTDAGRLIGYRGESLEALQLVVNQIMARKIAESTDFKKTVIDVSGWRQQKEEELSGKAKNWAESVLESGEPMELEPMSPWQRRVIHTAIGEIVGVESESVGEGRERHLIIKPAPTK